MTKNILVLHWYNETALIAFYQPEKKTVHREKIFERITFSNEGEFLILY